MDEMDTQPMSVQVDTTPCVPEVPTHRRQADKDCSTGSLDM